MSQQQTYEALKEILPELQAKLRHNIELEYQEELQKVQGFFKKYADDMIMKKQHEIRMQNEMNQAHLRRQLSLIQRQRQQWLTLQQNYRRTIFELTQRLKSKSSNDFSALTEIAHQNNLTEPDQPEMQVTSWKKKSKMQVSSQLKDVRKDTETENFNSLNHSITNMFKQATVTQNSSQDMLLQDRPLKEPESSQKKKWKIGQKVIIGAQTDERAKRQDTMVLSPPKMEEDISMKSSLLQPPNQTSMSKSSIFWNEQGKKKFLSMIRNIK